MDLYTLSKWLTGFKRNTTDPVYRPVSREYNGIIRFFIIFLNRMNEKITHSRPPTHHYTDYRKYPDNYYQELAVIPSD
jgi:hypothetical protein